MPYLYFRLKAADQPWAHAWQAKIHAEISDVEHVVVHSTAFLASSAHLFAEPGRTIRIASRAAIGAETFVHGPLLLGEDSSINPRCYLDGGRAGIVIGANVRIATGVRMFAFDHGMAPTELIREQPVRSRGILIGDDVWIGAGAQLTDGVRIHDGAVVAMGAVVTRDVASGEVVAGVPARVIKRRDPGFETPKP